MHSTIFKRTMLYMFLHRISEYRFFFRWTLRLLIRSKYPWRLMPSLSSTDTNLVHTVHIILTQHSFVFGIRQTLYTLSKIPECAENYVSKQTLRKFLIRNTGAKHESTTQNIPILHFHNIRDIVNYPNQSSSIRFDSVHFFKFGI